MENKDVNHSIWKLIWEFLTLWASDETQHRTAGEVKIDSLLEKLVQSWRVSTWMLHVSSDARHAALSVAIYSVL